MLEIAPISLRRRRSHVRIVSGAPTVFQTKTNLDLKTQAAGREFGGVKEILVIETVFTEEIFTCHQSPRSEDFREAVV